MSRARRRLERVSGTRTTSAGSAVDRRIGALLRRIGTQSCTGVLLALVAAVPAHAISLDPVTDRLFTAARGHRVAEVVALRRQFRAKPHVWALADYVADPRANVTAFVTGFPTTAVGVRDDYGYLWLAGALGGVNPYAALGALAGRGDEMALRKLVLASSLVPDGFIGVELQNDLASVAQARPMPTLAAIAALPPEQRDRVTAATVAWCGPAASILRAHAGGEAADAQRRIAATVDSNCPAAR